MAVTERCPYKCPHCSARFGKADRDLSTEQWLQIIGALQDLGTATIGITGGEPLIRDDIEQLIEAIDDRSTTILFTNGKDLSPDRAKSLKRSGLFILAVSLDSMHEETHNEIRGHSRAFENALRAIRHGRQAGLYTVVQSLVQKSEVTRKDLFGFPKVSSFPYTEGPEKFGCGAGIMHSYITSRGEMTPCDFVPVSFGNVLKEDIRGIYQRMNQAMGGMHMSCVSMQIAEHLQGKALPVNGDEAVRICRAVATNSYPRFFRELQDIA